MDVCFRTIYFKLSLDWISFVSLSQLVNYIRVYYSGLSVLSSIILPTPFFLITEVYGNPLNHTLCFLQVCTSFVCQPNSSYAFHLIFKLVYVYKITYCDFDWDWIVFIDQVGKNWNPNNMHFPIQCMHKKYFPIYLGFFYFFHQCFVLSTYDLVRNLLDLYLITFGAMPSDVSLKISNYSCSLLIVGK